MNSIWRLKIMIIHTKSCIIMTILLTLFSNSRILTFGNELDLLINFLRWKSIRIFRFNYKYKQLNYFSMLFAMLIPVYPQIFLFINNAPFMMILVVIWLFSCPIFQTKISPEISQLAIKLVFSRNLTSLI